MKVNFILTIQVQTCCTFLMIPIYHGNRGNSCFSCFLCLCELFHFLIPLLSLYQSFGRQETNTCGHLAMKVIFFFRSNFNAIIKTFYIKYLKISYLMASLYIFLTVLGSAMFITVIGKPRRYYRFASKPPQHSDYRNKLSHTDFWFPNAHTSYVSIILQSVKCAITLCLKKQCPYLN